MAAVDIANADRGAVQARSRFYFVMAVAMGVVVFAGFGPSFYVNGYFGEALGLPSIAALSPIIVTHGLVFSAWMLLLVAQTGLVATAKVRWHRRVGVLGALLAAAMVVLGVAVQVASMRRDLGAVAFDDLPPFLRSAIFGGFISMLLFAALTAAAIYWRRRPEIHKRLILLATIAMLGAATVRLARTMSIAIPPLGSLPLLGLVLADLFLVALAAHDMRTRGSVHPATLWGGSAIVLMQALGNSGVPHTAIVRQLMRTIVG